jgi:hypothetical protein
MLGSIYYLFYLIKWREKEKEKEKEKRERERLIKLD